MIELDPSPRVAEFRMTRLRRRLVMFEFEDSKFGKIKVINITEARASMAAIMNDKTCNYVITKNNKPIRVIVNFETFRQLKGASASRLTKTSEHKDPKASLKGLIGTRDKEMKRQGTSSMGGLLDPTPTKKPSLMKDEILEEKVIVPKVEGDKAIIDDVAEVEVHDQPVSTGGAELESVVETPSEPLDEVIEVEEEEKIVAEPVGPRTEPETGDYFQRFRKLYETPRHGPLFQAAKKNPEKVTSQKLSAPPVSEGEVAAEDFLAPPDDLVSDEVSSLETPEGYSSKKDEHPSIQDLLSELDNEKLSGEEEDSLSSEDLSALLSKVSKS